MHQELWRYGLYLYTTILRLLFLLYTVQVEMLMVPGLLAGQHGTDGNSMDWGNSPAVVPALQYMYKEVFPAHLSADTGYINSPRW